MKLKLLLPFIILLVGCHGKTDPVEYVARVGNSYLTVDELDHMFPERSLHSFYTEDNLNSVISNWVEKEVLFQEAKKIHFDKEKTLQNKRDIYFRDLVVDAYMKYYFQTNVKITEQDITNYYITNKKSFKRDVDEKKVSHIMVKDFEEANRIKRILSSNNSQLKDALYTKYKFETKIVKHNEAVKEIDETIFEYRDRRVYGPIPTDYGYHIIYVHKTYKKGTTRSIEEVRDEIIHRLTQNSIHENYIIFTDSLISNSDYEVNKNTIHKFFSER